MPQEPDRLAPRLIRQLLRILRLRSVDLSINCELDCNAFPAGLSINPLIIASSELRESGAIEHDGDVFQSANMRVYSSERTFIEPSQAIRSFGFQSAKERVFDSEPVRDVCGTDELLRVSIR